MALLSFTLSPESLGKFHDALVCLGKFSEVVCIEAVHDKLILTALNSSKSAYASFTFLGNKFFNKYHFRGSTSNKNGSRDKFNCKIYNKALVSVFKGRVLDPTREKDIGVEKCDVSIEDGDGKVKSRFIVKTMCRHGVLKSYRLTFEAVAPMHALFVKESAYNYWKISSKTLREFVEHFGPGTEQLDVYSEEGRVSFTSYTEKIMSGNEILKQPLQTTIAIDTVEFSKFTVEEKLHIVISVKDFKSIIGHAGINNTEVSARYSHPSSPMQITYIVEGIQSEFILMTIGESRAGSATPVPNGSRASSKRPAPRQALEAASSSIRAANMVMPPPPASAAPNVHREASKSKVVRPSPPPPQPSIQPDALFFPDPDGDRRWDPVDFDEEEDEMLLWDAGSDTDVGRVNSGQRLKNTESQNQRSFASNIVSAQYGADDLLPPTQILAPTQRISEVHGMFD
ncbi:DNA repair protein-like protein rad9 [Calycina marina]|uniref:DNA repair protein rad9 n=1 Tax=Calycina marina TaxID=1763456 RepID=A0A9P7ZBL4_9HELO|nr:DNA repair protein-like protein rad9 [Calycina marina]